MVVYTEKEEEEDDIIEVDIVELSPLGEIIKTVTSGVLGALLYLLVVTGKKIDVGNPRIFSLRAVLIPFIKKLTDDISNQYMNDVFEEPSSRLYQMSPVLWTAVNSVSYIAIKAYEHRYKALACVLAGGYVYLLNKNENYQETQ